MKIRCTQCKNIIAAYVAGCYIVTRGGREWIGRELVSIRCERCGAVWDPENDTVTSEAHGEEATGTMAK